MASMSTNFSERELRCKCGCGICEVDIRLLRGKEIYRALTGGRRCDVSSACRCPRHNRAVGGSDLSEHITTIEQQCQGSDIRTEGLSVIAMALIAEQVPEFRRIGIYPQDGFIHVGVAVLPNRWTRWSRINGVYREGLESGILWQAEKEQES